MENQWQNVQDAPAKTRMRKNFVRLHCTVMLIHIPLEDLELILLVGILSELIIELISFRINRLKSLELNNYIII